MKKIIQSILALIILSLSSGVLADNNQIKLTVKGYHNDGSEF